MTPEEYQDEIEEWRMAVLDAKLANANVQAELFVLRQQLEVLRDQIRRDRR